MRQPRPVLASATGVVAAACVAVFSFALAACFFVSPAWAAAPSPKVLAGLPPAERAAALQEFQSTMDRLRQQGVDRIYPQFALDLAKYPRGGVAHRNILVVLCQFPSDGFGPAQGPASVSTPRYFQRHFFSDDPNDGIVSLREYYRINSGGRLVISGTVTPRWLDMPHSYGYYVNNFAGLDFGAYPRSAQGLAEHAMAAAYEAFEGDLSFFDNDGPDGVSSSGDDDGYIDAVAVIVPGQGGETSCADPGGCQRLWAHETGIAVYSNCPQSGAGAGCLPGVQLGSVKGFLYFLGSEYNEHPGDNTSGTWFHEFSHTLGLPDLYDLTGGNGLGFFSLMALGNYLPWDGGPYTGTGPTGSRAGNLDAWSRQYLGFDNPAPVSSAGPYTLGPVSESGGSLKIWSNGEPGSEYFLVENRTRTGSDAFLPGQGMLVYHVDDTQVDNVSGNYRVRVVQADGLDELGTFSTSPDRLGDPADFFPGTTSNTTITESTSPSTRALSGFDTGIRFTNIAYASDSVSFDLQISTEPELRLVSYTIDDQFGDNQGDADPNETVKILPVIRNAGLQSGVLQLNLTESDPNVTVTSGLSIGNPLAPGASEPIGLWEIAIGNVTVPHAVPFTVNWSDDSGNSGSFSFVLTVGAVASLLEDFESGAEPGQFWTTQALPGSSWNEWHSSATRARQGARSAKLGSTLPLGGGSNEAQSYASLQDAVLISPAFDLAPNSELVFESYIDAETFGGTEAFDGGRVEIALNGGEWVPLSVDGGYGYQIKFDSEVPLRGADVFSGSLQQWRTVRADLTGYSGEARIRFRFVSDNGNAPFGNFGQLRVYEGWYVDHVRVQPRTTTGPTPRRLSLRGGPSPYRIGAPSAGSIAFRFSAPDGLPHPELAPVVRIFDVAGRLVRSISASADGLIASEFGARWDARDSEGQLCRAGIYFAKVDIQGKSESFRVVLLR